MRRDIRVEAILLQQFFIEGDTLHKEFDPGHLMFRGYFAEGVFEGRCVSGPVVERYSNPKQHDGRPGILTRDNDLLEIAAQAIRRKAAQAIIGAEFKDN